MNKQIRMVLGAALVLTLLLSGCAQYAAEKTTDGSAGTEIISETSVDAEPLPAAEPSAAAVTFEGRDLAGNAVSQDIFARAKLTMVNVWATYCNPCLSEMPGLGELAAECDQSEFQILGIVVDVTEGEDQSLAESLIQETGANYTHLLFNESLYDGFLADVSAVPTTFFVNQNGVILDRVVGAMAKTAWEAKINELLENM